MCKYRLQNSNICSVLYRCTQSMVCHRTLLIQFLLDPGHSHVAVYGDKYNKEDDLQSQKPLYSAV